MSSLLLSASSAPCFCQVPLSHPREYQFKSSKIFMSRRDSRIGSPRIRGNTVLLCPRSNLFVRAVGRGSPDEGEGASTNFKSSMEERKASGATAGNASTSLLSVLCPLLKLFGGGDPSEQRNEILEVATSSLSSLARLPWGSASLVGSAMKKTPQNPPQPLQLYEFEACPFCRRVREALTELDLSVEVYPCPKGSIRHREMVKNIGGKEQFPFLIDPNSNFSLYESGDIVKYLFQKYGLGVKPTFGLLESTLITGWMPTLLRAGRGMTLWQRAQKTSPPEKLILFSYENNSFARIVREALCELELPYILHNAGKGSSTYELLFSMSGSNEVPFLIDPNTGKKMSNYKKILSYLFQTYSESI